VTHALTRFDHTEDLSMRYFVRLLICWVLFLGALLAASEEARDSTEIEALVERLASDRFEEREEAAQRLLKYEADAVPSLRKAAQSADPQVRKRSAELLVEIHSTTARRELARAVQFAEDGAFEESVERCVRWVEEDPEDAALGALVQLAERLLLREKERFGNLRLPAVKGSTTSFPFLTKDLGAFVKKCHPLVKVVRSRHPVVNQPSFCSIVRGAGVTLQKNTTGLIVSSRDVIVSRECSHRLVITACGSVTVHGHANDSLILSGGDVAVRNSLAGTLIVARGNITLPHSIGYSSVFAAGSATVSEPGIGDLQAGARKPELTRSVLREHDTEGLGLIRFFDERKLGVEVLPNKAGVLVKEAQRGRPYAAVGLRPGDVISAIDGVEIASPESFRTTLRQRLAEGNRFLKLSVQRAGEKLELRVPRAE
jgi:hypothetical protein